MASTSLLRGPIATGLGDLQRCLAPLKCSSPTSKGVVGCCFGRPCRSARADVSASASTFTASASAGAAYCAPLRSALASGARAGPALSSSTSSAASTSGSSGSVSTTALCRGARLPGGGFTAPQQWQETCRAQQRHPQLRRAAGRGNVATAAAATAAADGGSVSPGDEGGLLGEAQRLLSSAAHQASRFWSLSGKFMPMVGLFFLLAFVNTILDSLKDTLVITAAGGGAQVIPYLTVYAVLPSSLVFLLAYSFASQRFRRQALFNGIVVVFMAFFAAFAYGLYPNHATLHPTGWADGLAAVLPNGLDGAVGMIRNWTFTLFFCMSELWGDVCLGLLFWGLANDTTSLADAPTLYPLFGLGANVAQALAGFVLKFFSGSATHGSGSFTGEVQSLMGVVMVFSAAALGLHHFISLRTNQQRVERRMTRRAERKAVAAEVSATRAAEAATAAEAAEVRAAGGGVGGWEKRTPENQLQPGSVASTSGSVATAPGGGGPAAAAAAASAAAEPAGAGTSRRRKGKQNMVAIYRTLASSVPIRCLVVMSMAQGLCTNLMEFAWKSHIRLLYPTPAEFTSFLGDVSTWQGIVTGMLMVLSPAMFERLGWRGVAAATPTILLYGGGAFFGVAMLYQFVMAPTAVAAASAAGMSVLQVLVYGGALLYVFSKSAKFSLFKPAEEMVYISLDEEGRTKGKAAIDVVGSQAGKSGGSVLQQVLLLLCGGAIAGQLPVMVIVFLAMSKSWLKAVGTLSRVADYGHASSIHESMQSGSSMSSMDLGGLDGVAVGHIHTHTGTGDTGHGGHHHHHGHHGGGQGHHSGGAAAAGTHAPQELREAAAVATGVAASAAAAAASGEKRHGDSGGSGGGGTSGNGGGSSGNGGGVHGTSNGNGGYGNGAYVSGSGNGGSDLNGQQQQQQPGGYRVPTSVVVTGDGGTVVSYVSAHANGHADRLNGNGHNGNGYNGNGHNGVTGSVRVESPQPAAA